VNSEERKWMDDLRAPLPASQRRKPDLFVTWALCAVPLAGRAARIEIAAAPDEASLISALARLVFV
jgi:hypothetical protein